jgi:hypothetical protein
LKFNLLNRRRPLSSNGLFRGLLSEAGSESPSKLATKQNDSNATSIEELWALHEEIALDLLRIDGG